MTNGYKQHNIVHVYDVPGNITITIYSKEEFFKDGLMKLFFHQHHVIGKTDENRSARGLAALV